jgi:ABC-type branched-subunit amino acid transport system ATPase component
VSYGPVRVVHSVDLTVDEGAIVALIGPNGAGKTTTFNACTGVVRTSRGSVRLGDYQLDGHNTATRAAHGLGRTFQRMELFNSMTVAQNVALGPEAVFSSRHVWGQLFAPRKEAAEVAVRAQDAMARCRIDHLANRRAGDLSTGQRRLVELARAIASPFRFLLLDEPSSGLDPGETEAFGKIVTDFVSDTGVGVLLVEHDMALVSSICTYIYVLDFGRLIFSGPTRTVLESDVVRAAYLGSTELELAPELAPEGV